MGHAADVCRARYMRCRQLESIHTVGAQMSRGPFSVLLEAAPPIVEFNEIAKKWKSLSSNRTTPRRVLISEPHPLRYKAISYTASTINGSCGNELYML